MPDQISKERALLILEHARVSHSKMNNIKAPGDFIASEENELLYDSLITRLQAIGENCKKIQKKNSQFFGSSVHLDVKAIIRFRDLVSHHYELLDYELIYQICVVEVPKIIKEFKSYFGIEDSDA